jgi:membrane protease YdiL (CAAX protease family)
MSEAAKRGDGFGMAVMVEAGIAVAALLLAWLFGVTLRDQFAAWGTPFVWAVCLGIAATWPMLLVFGGLVHARHPELRRLREHVEWMVREMFPRGSSAEFAMVALLAGIGEELLFRGVLQTKLILWTTPTVGLALASVLFGLAHALSRLYFAFAVGVGLFLGWLAFQYNDLTAPIVAHALYDFVALVYLSRKSRRPSASAPPQSEETQ